MDAQRASLHVDARLRAHLSGAAGLRPKRGKVATTAESDGGKALYIGNLHPYVNEVCLQVRGHKISARTAPCCTERGATAGRPVHFLAH